MNLFFTCDTCKTKRENKEASDVQDQLTALTSTVSTLVAEFQAFKQEVKPVSTEVETVEAKPWSDTEKLKKLKASLCIKANGKDVDLAKMKENCSKVDDRQRKKRKKKGSE